jgi:starch-binding outer membrane protein, SusD/RagB family
LLGTDPSRKGRLNRWSAYAYKARANLWSASIAKFGTLADNRLTGIPAARANEFYEKASAAAREVINSGNYSLLQGSDPVETHYGILVEDSNSEVIYELMYNGVELSHGHTSPCSTANLLSGRGCNVQSNIRTFKFL